MASRFWLIKLKYALIIFLVFFLLAMIVMDMSGQFNRHTLSELRESIKKKEAIQKNELHVIKPPVDVEEPKKQENSRENIVQKSFTLEDWIMKLETLGDIPVSDDLQKKRDFVKEMMTECWKTYVKYGFGSNEVDVVAQRGFSRYQIYLSLSGLTIIDSLDTLLIMGMYEEYLQGRKWVESSLKFSPGQLVNLFETNIRVFGGLLAAYYLTDDEAEEYADLTIPLFANTFPLNRVNDVNEINSGRVGLAEIGTLHLEYAALSQITGKNIYEDKVMAIQNKLKKIFYKGRGPLGSHYDIPKFTMTQSYSIGSESDSFYEYLLKSYVQDPKDEKTLDFFSDSIQRLDSYILSQTNDDHHYLYYRTGSSMEHLACFTGGMFALASTIPKFSDKDYLKRGGNLTETCYKSCTLTKSGLCPDIFNPNEFASGHISDSPYYLRPEIMESIFYMYRVTREKKYQDMGWNLIMKMHENCRHNKGGYSSISNVNSLPTYKIGTQESFFMAETLKYAYLLFSDVGFISLDEWVFNTEAHPLKIKKPLT